MAKEHTFSKDSGYKKRMRSCKGLRKRKGRLEHYGQEMRYSLSEPEEHMLIFSFKEALRT